jgi:hypothetical protein
VDRRSEIGHIPNRGSLIQYRNMLNPDEVTNGQKNKSTEIEIACCAIFVDLGRYLLSLQLEEWWSALCALLKTKAMFTGRLNQGLPVQFGGRFIPRDRNTRS